MLKEGGFFLAMTDVTASFDSRYFGPVSGSDILGPSGRLWSLGVAGRLRFPMCSMRMDGAMSLGRREGKIKRIPFAALLEC